MSSWDWWRYAPPTMEGNRVGEDTFTRAAAISELVEAMQIAALKRGSRRWLR